MNAVFNRRAAGSTFPPPPLLDIYTGAVIAYSSSRKLRGAYTGSAYRVRRASDNAEQDIGFLPSGQLDQASLSAFCSGTTGRVVLWYDQSGNGVNAQQPTLSKAPIVYQSGSANVINSTPALMLSGSEGMNMTSNVPWPNAIGQMTVVIAYRLTGSSIGVMLEAGYPLPHTSVSRALLVDVNDQSVGGILIGGSGGNGTTSYGFSPTAAVPHNRVFKGVWNPGGANVATEFPTFQINNAGVTPSAFGNPSGSSAVTQFNLEPMAIGARGDATSLRFVGSLGEIILYPGTTHATATALDLDVMTQYGIT